MGGTIRIWRYDDLDRVVTLANQLNAGELLNSYTYAFKTKGLRSRWTQHDPVDCERPRSRFLPQLARQATSAA